MRPVLSNHIGRIHRSIACVQVITFLSGGFVPSNLTGTRFEGKVHISDW